MKRLLILTAVLLSLAGTAQAASVTFTATMNGTGTPTKTILHRGESTFLEWTTGDCVDAARVTIHRDATGVRIARYSWVSDVCVTGGGTRWYGRTGWLAAPFGHRVALGYYTARIRVTIGGFTATQSIQLRVVR